MSFNVNWDPDKHREEHESEDHWELRRAFMLRWKNKFPEERLVCLARVFTNIELLGCRYPNEIMQEVANLSHEVAQEYRNAKKGKLQRTFVTASDAAEDRAKGKRREAGVLVEEPPSKYPKINFVSPGLELQEDIVETPDVDNREDTSKANSQIEINTKHRMPEVTNDIDRELNLEDSISNKKDSDIYNINTYLQDMLKVKCVNITSFNERMFQTIYGRMVLFIRPWATKLCNIQASCAACNLNLQCGYENRIFTLIINGKLVARATGDTKSEAKNIVEMMAWNRLREEVLSILVKEQWIAQGDSRISVNDISGTKRDMDFGKPVATSVAAKMMAMMGWKGGGLGADAQGIAEPIKPHLQMIDKAGLGHTKINIKQLRIAAMSLMQRFIASDDTLDVDLVFSSDFTKEERAQLHQIAKRQGLASKSYGDKKDDKDRFLVVRKKLDPFSLFRAIVEKGGNTPKYQVFIPAALHRSSSSSSR